MAGKKPTHVPVVLLAGGLGTRLAEETEKRPKPMIEIGGQPILWHIMKHYARYGFKNFHLALGYRGDVVKRFFLDYPRVNGNLTIDLATGKVQAQSPRCDDWLVHLEDTGQDTNTGGRVKRLQRRLETGTFMVTYGDGVSDVDLGALLRYHRRHGRAATVTAVRPPARFGGLIFDGDLVTKFTEKPQIGEGWINGGFLVFEPSVFDYLEDDNTSLEADALETLAREGQLVAYRHDGFWQCMDTLRDLRLLESLWVSGKAPWKTWDSGESLRLRKGA
jgi:glucose-1-phosphate cytidylyltransferase